MTSGGRVPESLNSSNQATPVKIIPPTPHRKLRAKSQGGSIRRSKSPGAPRAASLLPSSITVSLPSPAGNRKPSANHEAKSGGSTKTSTKKWDKYTKVKKAIKPYSVSQSEASVPNGGPRSRIGSSASNSSLKLLDSGSETPPMRHGSLPTKKGKKKKKSVRTVTTIKNLKKGEKDKSVSDLTKVLQNQKSSE